MMGGAGDTVMSTRMVGGFRAPHELKQCVKQRWRPPSAPAYLQTQEGGPSMLYATQGPQSREYHPGVNARLRWAGAVPGRAYEYPPYPMAPSGMDPEPKPPNGSPYGANLVEACSVDNRPGMMHHTLNGLDLDADMKFTRHARRREAKRQRKAAAAVERQFTTMMCDGAENRSDEQDDALPWYRTIASGRVQKHLMRFLNNFIVSKDLEDELGLHVADVFYHNSESESGPTMAALYEKLEQRVAERCPDRLAEFRKEALESLTALMAACEEREEQQERGREALKNAGHRGKPVRNAAKRLGKSRTEARKLAAMVAHYRALSLDDNTPAPSRTSSSGGGSSDDGMGLGLGMGVGVAAPGSYGSDDKDEANINLEEALSACLGLDDDDDEGFCGDGVNGRAEPANTVQGCEASAKGAAPADAEGRAPLNGDAHPLLQYL